MPGFVHRRAHQVIHCRIDHRKILAAAMLQVLHFGDQHTGIADYGAARLEHDRDRFAAMFFGTPAINTREQA